MSDTKVERRLRFAVEFQARLDAGEDIHSAYVAASEEASSANTAFSPLPADGDAK